MNCLHGIVEKYSEELKADGLSFGKERFKQLRSFGHDCVSTDGVDLSTSNVEHRA